MEAGTPADPLPSWAGPPLAEEFFARDPREVAGELIGCLLVSIAGSRVTGGRIVETEAYLGADDAGSHAATRGMTRRNATMYGPFGHLYVYFTYGNHHMLNLVCEPEGTAGAVLVRALEPLIGLEVMTARRNGRPRRELCSGPGKLAAALGLDLSDNGSRLGEGNVTVYAGPAERCRVVSSGRVGLSSGHEAPFRYFVDGSPFVSRGRTGPVRRRGAAHDRGRSRE